MKPSHHYIVVCKDDGRWVLATRRRFKTHGAAEMYLINIAVSREPIIVLID
jgi:hypothetical protein